MLHKVRLLDHEATQVKHHFMEPSQNRLAMNAALTLTAQMDAPKFFFLGEHNDGLWIAFDSEAAAQQFKDLKDS